LTVFLFHYSLLFEIALTLLGQFFCSAGFSIRSCLIAVLFVFAPAYCCMVLQELAKHFLLESLPGNTVWISFPSR